MLPAATAGLVYSHQFSGSVQGDGHVFTVAVGTLPSGLTLDNDGLLHGTPPAHLVARFEMRGKNGPVIRFTPCLTGCKP